MILLPSFFFSNDGAYYTSGNQLIPINETTIEVQKEILKLSRINNDYVEVDVYYEFYNPGPSKTITVGFEAIAPEGDAMPVTVGKEHPYMYDFSVNMNGELLPYQFTHVESEHYSSTDLGANQNIYSSAMVVYYFEAPFKQGKNIVKHTYRYKLSGGVMLYYDYEYVLTAANRWANGQIDDFTLIIDNGDWADFNISNSFFTNEKDWTISGKGKSIFEWNKNDDENSVRFFIHDGDISFHKKNFRPEGELFVYSLRYNNDNESIGFAPDNLDESSATKNYSKKTLRNLPFARRGYVFQDKKLQSFYEKQDWYIADPNYIPEIADLSVIEQEWYKKYK